MAGAAAVVPRGLSRSRRRSGNPARLRVRRTGPADILRPVECSAGQRGLGRRSRGAADLSAVDHHSGHHAVPSAAGRPDGRAVGEHRRSRSRLPGRHLLRTGTLTPDRPGGRRRPEATMHSHWPEPAATREAASPSRLFFDAPSSYLHMPARTLQMSAGSPTPSPTDSPSPNSSRRSRPSRHAGSPARLGSAGRRVRGKDDPVRRRRARGVLEHPQTAPRR